MAALSLYEYPFEWLGKSRASLPKVKTGCVGCKTRRVKCDEARPICNRCRKGNRSCVYQSPQTTISKHAALQIQLRYTAPRSPPLVKHFSSEEQRCAFDSFRRVSVEAFAVALQWSEWGNVVLQNSENDSALRHAVIAVGAMHEEAMRGLGQSSAAKDQKLLLLAYNQYHKAIKQLRNQLQQGSTRSVEANMLACALLISFDFLQGDFIAAGVHLAGGVAMLRCYLEEHDCSEVLITQVSTPWRTSLERSGIAPTKASFGGRMLLSYGYIDYWGSCWMDGLPALPEVSVLEGLVVRRPAQLQLENELNTSLQVFGALENRIREFLRAARGLRYQHGQQMPSITSTRQLPHQRSSVTFTEMKITLTKLLEEWHESYRDVFATFVCDEPWQTQAIKCLAVNHKKIETMLAAAQSDGAVDYRASNPAWKEVLTLSREVFEDENFPVSTSASATSAHSVDSLFAFPIGIIHPLYITAVSCGDVAVCQQAIEVLASRHWKEGSWDSIMMANIARQQLAMLLYTSPPHINSPL